MIGLEGPWMYAIIFLGKMVEVAFDTLRIVFIGKGRKISSALCGVVAVSLWIVIISSVLTGITEDPIKAVIYCIAYTLGILFGSQLEQWIAVGYISIHIVLSTDGGERLGSAMRECGFGVTILDGHSVDGTQRAVMLVQLRRRRLAEAMGLTKKTCPDAVISVSDVKNLHGGFIR